MSKSIPAFPQSITSTPDGGSVSSADFQDYEGMSLRDYFAAKAMQGYAASIGITSGHAPTDEDIARYSYQMADAMLKARESNDE